MFKQKLEKLRFEKIKSRQGDFLSDERINFYWYNSSIKVEAPNSAASMEKQVIEFLKLSGHQAEKIAVTGRFIDNTKTSVTSTGFRQTVGSKKYIPSTSTKGSADISSTIHGVSVKWEVKFSKGDKQSTEQKQYESAIQTSGGFYFVIRNLDEFYQKYIELLEHPKIQLMKLI